VIDPAIFAGDPPVREDGLCQQCLGPRRTERSQRYAKGIAQLDPWCSSDCARAFYNNPLPTHSIWSKPGSDRKFEAA